MGDAECTSENIFIHQRQCVGEEEAINMYFTLLSSLPLYFFINCGAYSYRPKTIIFICSNAVDISTESEKNINLHFLDMFSDLWLYF